MLKTKKLISLVSAAVLTASLIPSALAAEAAKVKEDTFTTESKFSNFTEIIKGSTYKLQKGFKGKSEEDGSLFIRLAKGSAYEVISMNEEIPISSDGADYQWTYVKFSYNYLIESNDNVKTYLAGENNSQSISTEITANEMKAGQWNHVDYVVGMKKRAQNSTRFNYEVITYLNGEYIGTTGKLDGTSHTDGRAVGKEKDSLKIVFRDVDASRIGYNLYLDDVKFEAYTDAYNGKTTADSLIKTPAPTIDISKANVKNGTVYPYAELNVSDITDARVYSDSTFKTQLTEGTVSVGNVIVAEQDGVIAYYYVTDVPNNYEVILNENFNGDSLGVLKHPYGKDNTGDNTYDFAGGLSGKQISDKSVNLKKGRINTPVDCLQFDFVPKANSYLSIDLTFMPTESEQFNELRLNTGGNNLASPIKNDAFHMNKWNKVRYVIFFDEKRDYTTKSYVNGNIYEQGLTNRSASNLKNYVRIGVAGKALNEGNTGICTTTYLDDISVTEHVGTEPGADAMPELKAIEGTKTSISGIVGNFTIDGAIDVSSLTGTKGETVRAYLYDSTTKTLGEQITSVDASTSQMIVVEGANGAISYYFVQPAFSIDGSLLEAGVEFEPEYGLSPVKYTYTLKAVNNGDNDKDIYIAMGRYDKDGNLKNLTFEKGTVSKNTSNFEKQLVIDLTDDDTLDEVNDYLKVFVWDANMTPYKGAFKAQ